MGPISSLSQICKIRNAWKLPSPFSKNTLISRSGKSFWSLKTLFWKKKGPTYSKMVMKIFNGFETSGLDILKP
jgi:hypothetical protein